MTNYELAKLDLYTVLERAGYQRDESLIGRALILYKTKNIPLNHLLAEVLIAHYLRERGFSKVDIERNVGSMKCDVVAHHRSIVKCVEIEFLFVPPNHVVDYTEFMIARHVKKLIAAAKNGIEYLSFAYPRYVVPPIPLELVRPTQTRSDAILRELIAITRKFFPLHAEDIEFLRTATIHSIMLFDLSTGHVVELNPQTVEVLLTLYESFILR